MKAVQFFLVQISITLFNVCNFSIKMSAWRWTDKTHCFYWTLNGELVTEERNVFQLHYGFFLSLYFGKYNPDNQSQARIRVLNTS